MTKPSSTPETEEQVTSRMEPCVLCGTLFDPLTDYNGWRISGGTKRTRCSKQCENMDRKGLTVSVEMKNCAICGNEFNPRLGPDGKMAKGIRKTCSDDCRQALQRRRNRDKMRRRLGYPAKDGS